MIKVVFSDTNEFGEPIATTENHFSSVSDAWKSLQSDGFKRITTYLYRKPSTRHGIKYTEALIDI